MHDDSDPPNPKLPEWQNATSYILTGLAVLLIPLILFWPAFVRLDRNPIRFDGPPIVVIESFWQYSTILSALMISVAVAAIVLLIARRPRKIVYVALAATLFYVGAISLHEQAKQAKISKLYERPANASANAGSVTGNPAANRELRKTADKLLEAINKLELTYIESEVYGKAWKGMITAVLAFWIGWLLQFHQEEYKKAWNWALSKAPVFEQKLKHCGSCGASNFLEASRCKYCGSPFLKS